ncbi:hypothetical protein K1719_020688 [Acacia pycnantha]|nr:hypothetical protein K1719_020688 [Acacia pycnantha]
MTGGAPPPAEVLFKMEELGFVVTYSYGLTETYGSDPVTMKSVPADAKTMGDVMFRGNTVMNGYLKSLEATQEAFKGRWFRSDLGVKHPDGYIELKDQSKDIIISGGENISSIELEGLICCHPAVYDAAVAGRPDDFWGETPCAFVKLKEGFSATEQEIIDFCRKHLPHYMAPKTGVFQDFPKTSTEVSLLQFDLNITSLPMLSSTEHTCETFRNQGNSFEDKVWLFLYPY